MIRFFCCSTLAILLGAGLETSSALAQKKTPAPPDDPHLLSLEVLALESLNRLDLTTPQLEALLRLSKGTASAVRSQPAAKVTPAFVKTLKALHNALVAEDDDRIEEFTKKLGDIMDKDKIRLDEGVAISELARRNAMQVLRLLQPAQVLAYMQSMDEDDVDLLEILEEALDKGKELDAGKWKELRDRTAAEAAWLLAGSDDARTRSAVKLIAGALDQQHNAKSKNAAPDLEKQVEQLIGGLDPFLIVRNVMERDMAELLSNPRLPHAIEQTLAQRRRSADDSPALGRRKTFA
jgi:hypothetical protein